MWENVQVIGNDVGVLLAGLATGIALTITVIAPNTSFDRLDGQRANGHVRALLRSGSFAVGFIYIAAAMLFLISAAYGAGSLSALAAFGFFTNFWTLAPSKRIKGVSVSGREKSKRVIAMSMSIMFMLAGLVSGIIGLWNI